MKAKEMLEELEKLDGLIEAKAEQLERLRTKANSTTKHINPNQVQTSRDPLQREKLLSKISDLEMELQEATAEAIEREHSYISLLEQLKISEYRVLYKRYVEHKDMQTIASELDRSYSWATGIHSQAIKSLQKVLDNQNTT